MTTRRCPICSHDYPVRQFHKGSGYRWCVDCTRRKWREQQRARYRRLDAEGRRRTVAKAIPCEIVAPGHAETVAGSLPTLGAQIARSLAHLKEIGVDLTSVTIAIEEEDPALAAVFRWDDAEVARAVDDLLAYSEAGQ